jgi:hypothetical protein
MGKTTEQMARIHFSNEVQMARKYAKNVQQL